MGEDILITGFESNDTKHLDHLRLSTCSNQNKRVRSHGLQ